MKRILRLHTDRMHFRRKVFYALPMWARENSFETFMSILCIFAAAPLIGGQVEADSVEATLPYFIVATWGVALAVGPVLTIFGLVMQARTRYPRRIFFQRLEAWGLSMLAYVGYLYSLAIFLLNPSGGFVAAMIILGFGLTCHFRELAVMIQIADFLEGIGVTKNGR